MAVDPNPEISPRGYINSRYLDDKAGVAVTPGVDFDPLRGAGTLRFSYARATEDIAEGLRRLTEFMAAR